MLWFALFIPSLAVLVLFFFRCRIFWFDLPLLLVVSFVILCLSKFCTDYMHLATTEYWTGYVVQAEYEERWNELVTYTETYTETHTDSKGKTHTETKTRTVQKVEEHPPVWRAVDNNGIWVSISKQHFEILARRWHSREFVNMHRFYHTVNGNKYIAKFSGVDKDMEVITTKHSYKNKVINSDSVFNFREITKEEKKEYGLYDYPLINVMHYMPNILGPGDPDAEHALSRLNAKLGKSKQIRVFVLIFPGKSLDAGIAQQNYWKNGNKNELVICIGLGGPINTPTWCHVFSWTDKPLIHLEIQDFVLEQSRIDLVKLSSWLENEIIEKWERKQFKDFDYISVQPTWWAILIAYVLVILLCGFYIYLVVKR